MSLYLNLLKLLRKLQRYWFSDFSPHSWAFQNELKTPLWKTDVVKPFRLFKCPQSRNSYVNECLTVILSWVQMSKGAQQEHNIIFCKPDAVSDCHQYNLPADQPTPSHCLAPPLALLASSGEQWPVEKGQSEGTQKTMCEGWRSWSGQGKGLWRCRIQMY